jgi:hypothetical protein
MCSGCNRARGHREWTQRSLTRIGAHLELYSWVSSLGLLHPDNCAPSAGCSISWSLLCGS